jgi:hypothetical protein
VHYLKVVELDLIILEVSDGGLDVVRRPLDVIQVQRILERI